MTDQERSELEQAIQPVLDRAFQPVLSKLEGIAKELDGIKQEVTQTQKDLTQTQKWQDRTWDVVKWVGGISAGLAISAAIALVGLVFRYAATGQ